MPSRKHKLGILVHCKIQPPVCILEFHNSILKLVGKAAREKDTVISSPRAEEEGRIQRQNLHWGWR